MRILRGYLGQSMVIGDGSGTLGIVSHSDYVQDYLGVRPVLLLNHYTKEFIPGRKLESRE